MRARRNDPDDDDGQENGWGNRTEYTRLPGQQTPAHLLEGERGAARQNSARAGAQERGARDERARRAPCSCR